MTLLPTVSRPLGAPNTSVPGPEPSSPIGKCRLQGSPPGPQHCLGAPKLKDKPWGPGKQKQGARKGAILRVKVRWASQKTPEKVVWVQTTKDGCAEGRGGGRGKRGEGEQGEGISGSWGGAVSWGKALLSVHPGTAPPTGPPVLRDPRKWAFPLNSSRHLSG